MMKIRYFILFTFLTIILNCNLDTSYDDIINRNLIPDGTLDQWSSTNTGSMAGDTGLDETYITYEQVSENDGYSNSSSYRLELKNLVPNGDFETGSINTDTWDDGNTTPSVINGNQYGSIVGNRLSYDFNATNYISFDLNDLTDSAFPSTRYRIRFNFRAQGKVLYDFNNNVDISFLIDPEQDWSETYDTTTTATFPTKSINSIITHPANDIGYFSVGSPVLTSTPGQAGTIDNLSIVRADGNYGVSFQIEESITSEGIELLPGTYRFSIHVKNEDKDNITPNTNNRFAGDYVELKIEGPTSNSSTNVNRAVFEEPSDWTDWTQLSVVSASIRPGEGELPITLTVLPYFSGDRYSGSILISSPTLEFIP